MAKQSRSILIIISIVEVIELCLQTKQTPEMEEDIVCKNIFSYLFIICPGIVLKIEIVCSVN